MAYNCDNPHLLIYHTYILHRLKDFRFSSKILARYSYRYYGLSKLHVPQVLDYFLRRRMKVWKTLESFSVNKNPTRCNSMQIFIYCTVTLHVSGVTAPIIRSIKNCNRSLRYRSYCKIQGLTGMNC